MRARLAAKAKSKARGKNGPGSSRSVGSTDPNAEAAIEAEFLRFKDADSDEIQAEGVVALFGEELKLDVESDVEVLIVAWKCGCDAMGVITKEEFLRGFKAMRCSSVAALKSRLGVLKKEIQETADVAFKDFYKYVFQYARDGQAKTVTAEVVAALLRIVMAGRSAHLEAFCDFLETRGNHCTADQWAGFLSFSRNINADFSNYDEDGAWPSLLDDFVEAAAGGTSSEGKAKKAAVVEDAKSIKEREAKAREERIAAKAKKRAEKKAKAAAAGGEA